MKRPPAGGRPALTADGHRKEMIALLRENAYGADMWSVWSDFIEMSAIALSNVCDISQRDAREARYMAIVGRYTKEQAMRFAGALSALTMAMEVAGFADVLGAAFMELELGNKWAGQFFTPYPVCQLMAQINMGEELTDKLQERGFVTVCDPACGAAAMPIAMAEAMHLAGHNYQQCLHVTAQDVDARAAYMAYIQLSILHVPAVVIVGNSLLNESREQWYTAAHIWKGWNWKLSRYRRYEAAPIEPLPGPPVETEQPELFGLFA